MPNRQPTLCLIRILAFLAASINVFCACAQEPSKAAQRLPLDVLVVAPHPDDEIIGCGGMMLQALSQHKRVGVVIITSGDGYPALTAAASKKNKAQLTADDFIRAGGLRQQHSITAAARIGLAREELIFLGYPDSGLEKMYTQAGDTPFQQRFTHKSETYGAIAPDYHSLAHGKPAPYLKASLVGDLAEIIRERNPKEIYVTNEADKHPDHRMAFSYVRDAIAAAKFQGSFFTYIVHGDPLPRPPDLRVKLTREQYATKRLAILDHQAGTSPIHDHLADDYMKEEEVFWKIPLPPVATT